MQSVEGIDCYVSSKGGVRSRAVVVSVYERERERERVREKESKFCTV